MTFNLRNTTLLLALLGLAFATGCGDEDKDTALIEADADTDADTDTDTDADADTDTDTDTDIQTEFEVLSDYLATSDLDLPTLLTSWVITPQSLFDAGLENYFIMDIRTGDKYEIGVNDFEEGHIKGAHSVAMADVITYEAEHNTGNLPVVVYCYTGTSAAQAVMALRLEGVEAQSLMWGMSGWHSDFDLWTVATGDAANDYAGAWLTSDPPTLPSYDAIPTIATGEADGAAILEAQLNARVLADTNKVAIADVLSDPEDYFIANYWDRTDWDYYGHIDGAIQVETGSLGLDSLSMMDPAGQVVVYCWSGQTAAMIASWLRVLGYDAYALLYSANGMIYNSLEAHKWTGALEFSYETGAE